jgi:hypothetical protein
MIKKFPSAEAITTAGSDIYIAGMDGDVDVY